MTKPKPDSKRATDFAWTDDAVALLRQLWDEELSMSGIAGVMSERLGVAVSRNTVLGKVHRLKLKRARPEPSKPAAPAEPEAAPVETAADPEPAPIAPPPEPEPPAPVMDLPFAAPQRAKRPAPGLPDTPGVTLFDIGLFCCRWPVSRDGEPFRFCGARYDPANTYSWCEAHMAIGLDQRSADRRRTDHERAQRARAGKAKAA